MLSFVIIGILGISTISFLYGPQTILPVIRFLSNFKIISLLPFITIGGIRFLTINIWAPTFNLNLCWGKLGNSIWFKNSTGNYVAWFSATVSIDLYVYSFVFNLSNIFSFIYFAYLLVAAKIVLSLNHFLFL